MKSPRNMLRLLALAVLLGPAAAGAAPAPLPLVPPPPDLAHLVQFAESPQSKPLVPLSEPALPETPEGLPALPRAAIVLPLEKPMAPVPWPRTLPCVGAWLRIASESLECGIAKFGRGEYEEASRALEQAARPGTDRDVLRQARYWLGEAYWRLGRIEEADWQFRQIAQETGARDEITVWALDSAGWTALRLRDLPRARDAFARLVGMPVPVPLDVYGRHGLALAAYGLGLDEEAEKVWADLAVRAPARSLARDVFFWHGESLGRVGQFARAESELGRFVRGGAHPLLETGLLRLGWWSLRGGRFAESASALRAYLLEVDRQPRREAPARDERDYGEAALAVALLSSGDLDGARQAARGLQTRQSPLAIPVLLRMTALAVEKRRGADAQALAQELLAAKLTAATRAWVLLLNGEAFRIEGNRDEARTQYQLVRTVDAAGPSARHAAQRLALTNFELREYAQAAADVRDEVARAPAPELRTAMLLVQAEAAYAAGDFALADGAYRRLLAELPNGPQTSLIRLSIAWTALRRGQAAEAREHLVDFATAYPMHPNTPDALELASELALEAGDYERARRLIDLLIAQHPANPRTDFARLNLGILLLRTGRTVASQLELTNWLGRSPVPHQVGRARATLGAALLATGSDADAAREFARGRSEGGGPFATLGAGVAAMAQGRLDEATRDLTEARDSGTAPIVAAAEYGLAAVAFQRGKVAEFRRVATAALDAAPTGPMAPRLLYVLTGIAVAEQDWPRALATARRLISQFKDVDQADDALERIGAGAAQVRAWPVVSEAYQLLRQQYPQSPFVEGSRLAFGEAELEAGRTDVARRELEAAIPSVAPAQAGPALLLLARARQAAGDRAGALEAFSRAARTRGADWDRETLFAHANLLLADKRWEQARGVLDNLLRSSDQAVAVDAAQAIGQSYQGEGNHMAAAEYFLTAAYLAPQSPTGRRALYAAAQSFAALRQPEAAATLYRKLLAQPDLPGDLAAAARAGLAAAEGPRR